MDLFDAVLTGPLVMRDAADDVTAEAHRLTHQLLAVRKRQDPVLWKGDQPKIHEIADLVAKLDEGAESRERGIADVDVRADQPGALRDLPEDRLTSPLLDVLVRQWGLPLGPGLDPFE